MKPNREKLQAALATIREIATDQSISPSPYVDLLAAADRIERALWFVLDMNERDWGKAARQDTAVWPMPPGPGNPAKDLPDEHPDKPTSRKTAA